MCWNPDISINTFIFSVLTLLFIYLTNTYSKYKTKTFDNPLMYLLFFEVVLIQLIEFFLWKNLKNDKMNKLLSRLACIIILLQPFTIILMIQRYDIKHIMLALYSLFVILLYINTSLYHKNSFRTTVGINGHLSWEWMNYKGYQNIFLFILLLFYIIPTLFTNNFVLFLFVIVSLVISFVQYFKYNTFGSMWCWLSNIFLLYFIINILIIQPYKEYNNLC
uniref:Uncharacterized protein n=1 Tax=viral metagenome TaxID=1070528 RepID=A0A6C0JJ96_9ZZZZ